MSAFHNEWQRVRVWLVAWLSLKVSKQITDRIFRRNVRKSAVTKQLIIHVLCCTPFLFFYLFFQFAIWVVIFPSPTFFSISMFTFQV